MFIATYFYFYRIIVLHNRNSYGRISVQTETLVVLVARLVPLSALYATADAARKLERKPPFGTE